MFSWHAPQLSQESLNLLARRFYASGVEIKVKNLYWNAELGSTTKSRNFLVDHPI